MRHLHRAPVVLLIAALASACAGTDADWTYAPAPVTAAPSASGSAGPSASPSSDGNAIRIAAASLKFDPTAIEAPAETPFTIEFDNQDTAVPHNVAIHEGEATGAEVFKGEIDTGPVVTTYDVPALAAGAYTFTCTVHPAMTGALTVR